MRRAAVEPSEGTGRGMRIIMVAPHHKQQHEQLQAGKLQDGGRVAVEAAEAEHNQDVRRADGHDDDRHPEGDLRGPSGERQG